MQIHGGKSVFVCIQNIIDVFLFDDVGTAFVVQDDVVSLGPVWAVIQIKAGLGAGIG